jgi:hypothetical protein
MSNSELLPDAKTIIVGVLERFPVIYRGCDTKSLNTKLIEPLSICFGADFIMKHNDYFQS